MKTLERRILALEQATSREDEVRIILWAYGSGELTGYQLGFGRFAEREPAVVRREPGESEDALKSRAVAKFMELNPGALVILLVAQRSE